QTEGIDVALANLPTGASQSRDGRPSVGAAVDLSGGAMAMRPAPGLKPLPAIVAAGTLAQMGIGLERPFTLRTESTDVPMIAVGSIDYFPTLYPGVDDFLLVPRLALLDRLTRGGSLDGYANEVW